MTAFSSNWRRRSSNGLWALGAELTDHLGYEKGDPSGRGTANNRYGTFEPVIVPKGARRFDGFDDRILSQFARGMTVPEIQSHMREFYGEEVSPDPIGWVPDP